MLSEWSDLGKPTKKSVEVNLSLFDRANLLSSYSEVGGGRKGWWVSGGRKKFLTYVCCSVTCRVCARCLLVLASVHGWEQQRGAGRAGWGEPATVPTSSDPAWALTDPLPWTSLWGVLSFWYIFSKMSFWLWLNLPIPTPLNVHAEKKTGCKQLWRVELVDQIGLRSDGT